MARTESVADFELLAAGPGGVIAAGRPAGGVTDGVLGRRRRSDAAHEEQRGQGQRRATGRHCRRSIEQIIKEERNEQAARRSIMQGRRSKSKRDAEPIASHGPFYTHGTDSTSEQLGVGGVAFAGVGWEQEQVVGSSNDDLLRCTDRRRWTRDDDLETTLLRDQFTCRSIECPFGK